MGRKDRGAHMATRATKAKTPRRQEATWDLTPLFASDDDPRRESKRRVLRRMAARFIDAWRDRTDYLKDPRVLRRALDEYEAWRRRYGTEGDEGYYFWLRIQQDQNDPKLKAQYNQIEEFSKKLENESQFFYLRIARIRPEDQERFLTHPALAPYRHYLERIFVEARYHLSEPEEKILNLKAPLAHTNWTRMTSGFLAKEVRTVTTEDGQRKPRPFAEILGLLNSRQRRVRNSAAVAFNAILEQYVEVAEAELNAVLQNKKIDDELRGAPRPDTLRHIADDVETEVVDALLDAVERRFSVSARYYALKARLLGTKRLAYHERNVEYGVVAKRYPFPKAAALVDRVMQRLDPQFGAIFASFVGKRRIDVYPRKGKDSGAFCIHHLLVQPTYILLNHTGKLHDVLTIAHEVGHGINNELIRAKRHALDFGTPTSTAEVASTFMEDFVLDEVLRDADDELRLAVLLQKLNDDVSSIFRQVACYRFEQDLHRAFREKGYLSRREIGLLFQKNMAAYMGPAVEQSPGSENWWVYWNHIRYFFYVYSYASGLLISKSLQNAVRRDPRFIEQVKGFLSAGLSASPKTIFADLGIDITNRQFWDQGLDEVERLLNETEALARNLGKIRGK